MPRSNITLDEFLSLHVRGKKKKIRRIKGYRKMLNRSRLEPIKLLILNLKNYDDWSGNQALTVENVKSYLVYYREQAEQFHLMNKKLSPEFRVKFPLPHSIKYPEINSYLRSTITSTQFYD